MNPKVLTVAVSALVGIAALIVAVMAVGSVHLGADKAHLTQAEYARRVTATNQIESRIQALAKDVPPALPAVPARLASDGTPDPSTALPAESGPTSLPIPQVSAQTAAGTTRSTDGDHEEGEAGSGQADD